MSLDVYLSGPGKQIVQPVRVFARAGNQTREITRDEWERHFPGTEPVTIEDQPPEHLYSANITHNLMDMADAAGLYIPLWRPEEAGLKEARLLIEPLARGLARLRADPEWFRIHDAPNGWGRYGDLVEFVEEYLAACRQFPDATVGVCR